MRRQIVRSTWDDGWSGKHIHSPYGGDDSSRKETTTVHDRDDEAILYAVEDGIMVAYMRKRPIGFIR